MDMNSFAPMEPFTGLVETGKKTQEEAQQTVKKYFSWPIKQIVENWNEGKWCQTGISMPTKSALYWKMYNELFWTFSHYDKDSHDKVWIFIAQTMFKGKNYIIYFHAKEADVGEERRMSGRLHVSDTLESLMSIVTISNTIWIFRNLQKTFSALDKAFKRRDQPKPKFEKPERHITHFEPEPRHSSGTIFDYFVPSKDTLPNFKDYKKRQSTILRGH